MPSTYLYYQSIKYIFYIYKMIYTIISALLRAGVAGFVAYISTYVIVMTLYSLR